jgi:hypothetical protein
LETAAPMPRVPPVTTATLAMFSSRDFFLTRADCGTSARFAQEPAD